MNIYSNTVEGGKVNPSDYVNRGVKMKVGNTYPNLYTQATHAMNFLEKTSSSLIKEVQDTYQRDYNGSIDIILDSIYHYIENEISLSEGDSEYFTKDILSGIADNVYQRVELAKSMMEMFRPSGRLEELDDVIKLTKQDVLL